MLELVFANLKVRPFRTLISVVGVALGVILVVLFTGLASASSLFIIASGLTLVFGVTRIVNFAHGSLYMLGAYFAVTIVPRLLDLWPGAAGFWFGILLSALIRAFYILTLKGMQFQSSSLLRGVRCLCEGECWC